MTRRTHEIIPPFEAAQGFLKQLSFRVGDHEPYPVHLVLWDANKNCYHSYLSGPTRQVAQDEIEPIIQHLRAFIGGFSDPNKIRAYLKKWLDHNVVRDGTGSAKKCVVWSWLGYNERGEYVEDLAPVVPRRAEDRTSAAQILLSAIPMYRGWDIVGMLDSDFFHRGRLYRRWRDSWFGFTYSAESNASILYSPELGQPEGFQSYDSFLFSRAGTATGNSFETDSSLWPHYQRYADLYSELRARLYDATGSSLDGVYVPVYMEGVFYALVYVDVVGLATMWRDHREELLRKADELRSKVRELLIPLLRTLYSVEFQRRVTTHMPELLRYRQFRESYCRDLNFLLRCSSCMLGDRAFCWRNDSDVPIYYNFVEEPVTPTASEDAHWINFLIPGEEEDDTLCGISCAVVRGDSAEAGDFHLVQGVEQVRLQQGFRSALEEFEAKMETLRQARKAAIAAIMSRNMSHNIGSHVLARLSAADHIPPSTGTFRLVSTSDAPLVSGQWLSKRIDGLDAGTRSVVEPGVAEQVHEIKEPVARLNAYLRTRMDLIADMATSAPPLFVSKSLYSDVLAYFRPRGDHEPIYPWQTLLLDRISGTDLGSSQILLSLRDTSGARGPDPMIAFPNDMLGAHALYVILENVIRNCAKHSGAEHLRLTVELDVRGESGGSPQNEFLRATISDELGSCRNDPNLVKRLNKSIADGLLENGVLRRSDWGIREMVAAAAYLRGIPPEMIDDPQDPPLLTAVDVDGSLGYALYLRRAKEVVVLDFAGVISKVIADGLCTSAVDVISEAKHEDLHRAYPHSFVLILCRDALDLGALSWDHASLPHRRLVYLTDGGQEEGPRSRARPWSALAGRFARADGELIVEAIWEQWLDDRQPLPRLVRMCGVNAAGERLSSGGDELIVLDNHGENFERIAEEKNCVHYDPYGSASPQGQIISSLSVSNLATSALMRSLCCEWVDAALLHIGIIDERIQKGVQNQSFRSKRAAGGTLEVPMQEVLARTGVFVPAVTSVNLNTENFSSRPSSAEGVESFSEAEKLAGWICGEADNFAFLVIHLGLIEKLSGSTSSQAIQHWIDEFTDRHPGTVLVVTSGRGHPPNLPRNVAFVHYSGLARYVLEVRSKLHLCRVLHASRGASACNVH
jgi:hypothetical protein